MRSFEVRISFAARADMDELRRFLDAMLSLESAESYANNMRAEIKMLSLYAECHGRTTSQTLRLIHPDARKMVSHNRKWLYVYHIEGDFVVVDRILPVKMNKG